MQKLTFSPVFEAHRNIYIIQSPFDTILAVNYYIMYHIGGVMVGMLASSAVDCGFESRSGQTKDYKIGICSFTAKCSALRKKSKDWLTWNQDNVFKWGRHFYPQTVVSVS